MMGLTIDRVSWFPQRALSTVARLSKEANGKAAREVYERADMRVPVATEHLRSTGRVTEDDDEAVVSYGTDYAVPLRARGRALHGRDAHWLDNAVDEGASDVGDIYANTLRSGWPRA